jgi:hypothetical protein
MSGFRGQVYTFHKKCTLCKKCEMCRPDPELFSEKVFEPAKGDHRANGGAKG